MPDNQSVYRSRLAPTPTGYLHLGHARTFCIAAGRASAAQGTLILRSEDLDSARCKSEYSQAMFEDLRWLGLQWSEGPDVGGPYQPYEQSQRRAYYQQVWRQLCASGHIYPSPQSRRDLRHALQAPHDDDEDAEPLFPVELRPPLGTGVDAPEPGPMNWRFRVPDGETIAFQDGRLGAIERVAGRDFGDFVVWRRDRLCRLRVGGCGRRSSHADYRGRPRRRPADLDRSPTAVAPGVRMGAAKILSLRTGSRPAGSPAG